MIRVSILSVLLLWPAVALPQGLSYADRSGTITTGGTAQVAMPAWSGRHGCVIQNQSAGSLWVSETATAIAGPPSILIPAGSAVPLHVAGVGAGVFDHRRHHGAGVRGA